MHPRLVSSLLAAAMALPGAASAREPQGQAPPAQEDAEARKKLEEEIAKELGQGGAKPAPERETGQPGARATGATPPAGAAPSAGEPPSTGAPPSAGGNPMARLLLLPDISAIGSFSVAYDGYDVEARSPREGPFGPEGKPKPLFQELELALQSVVDPYARADIFVSFGPDEVSVEEAYLTTLSLPAGFQVRAGKLFSPFGRQNQQHPHTWEFVDAPLARGRLVADEVLSGPGIDVAWLAPLPWFAELHLAGQGTAPAALDEERLTGVARLLQYFSLGEATTLGLGVSAARRDEAPGAFRDLGAIDAYLRWRPLGSRSYLALQGELYGRTFRNDDQPADEGLYAQAFLRQSAYWGYGVRYDWAPTAGDAPSGKEHRVGALATWFPSEFQRIRLQVSYDRVPGGADGIEALLALELGIGSHGAHPF